MKDRWFPREVDWDLHFPQLLWMLMLLLEGIKESYVVELRQDHL